MGGPATIDGKAHPETDNFQPCQFVIDGVTYSSAENYFQWVKTIDEEERKKVLKSGPGMSAWSAGQRVTVRDDWEAVKVEEMYKGNLAKFQQNKQASDALIGSGTATVKFRGSTDFWNLWNGRIMERIRAELRQDGDADRACAEEIRRQMDDYARSQTH